MKFIWRKQYNNIADSKLQAFPNPITTYYLLPTYSLHLFPQLALQQRIDRKHISSLYPTSKMTQPDTFSLANKVAIVTGSGRENGIGAAIAFALARNGASVVVNYVSDGSASRAEAVVLKLRSPGAKALAIQADVTTPEGAQKIVRQTLEGFGVDHIDIHGKRNAAPSPSFTQKIPKSNTGVVNNAGFGAGQGLLATEISPEDVQKNFTINVFSTLYMSQAAVPHMPRGGRIVNVGSVVSHLTTLPGVSLYGASKAAQDYLTGVLALELGKSKGITVNTVAPGATKTDAGEWFPDGDLRDVVGKTLMGGAKLEARAAEPEEVADAVLLVVSEQAGWIPGQYIAASGGVTA